MMQTAMTPGDCEDSRYAAARAAIANRLALATQAADARRADAYADSFTEQGVLHLTQPIAGREAIRAWMKAPSVIPAPTSAASGTAHHVSHHLTTMAITLTGEASATARTYWLVITARGVDHSGYYDDRLEKHDGQWLLAHRRPRTLWRAPDSLVGQGGAGPA